MTEYGKKTEEVKRTTLGFLVGVHGGKWFLPLRYEINRLVLRLGEIAGKHAMI